MTRATKTLGHPTGVYIVLFLLGLASASTNVCPKPDPDFRTKAGGGNSKFEFLNKTPVPLSLRWVDTTGKEINLGTINGNGGSFPLESSVDHGFRVYYETYHNGSGSTAPKSILVKEYVISSSVDNFVLEGTDEFCDEIIDHFENHQPEQIQQQKELMNQELTPLIAPADEPCLPEDDSTKWSCVRRISKEDYAKRLDELAGIKFGFASLEESTPPSKADKTRKVGDTQDDVWSSQIPKIPRVSKRPSPGYLKMGFTDSMKELLLPFYEERKKGGPQDAVRPHRVIPGGFTNSHTVPMSILSLDYYPDIKSKLIKEMQRVLEWWTERPLVPTATFGIRIYHNQSMLINHVDRADTHVASAVIQVGQDGLQEGWPLEVLNEDGSCSEVYLQPGQMVLYEGARFMHGRPMRLNGTDFANVFSHFRPVDWNGPGKSPNYDRKLDQDGYVIGPPATENDGGGEL